MIKKRILAFLIDYYCITFISMILINIIFIFFNREPDDGLVIRVFSLFVVCGLLLKDGFGQSLGKRLGKFRIVTADGQKPPIYKLILRNITTFIWPIELIAIAISESNTRFSDKLLGLRVTSILNKK